MLGGNAWGDKGAAHLAAGLTTPDPFRSLKVLDLKKNDITELGATALAKMLETCSCPQLQFLDLHYNGIGDAGLERLSVAFDAGSCPQLRRLVVARNGVHDRGAARLAQAIENGATPKIFDVKFSHDDSISAAVKRRLFLAVSDVGKEHGKKPPPKSATKTGIKLAVDHATKKVGSGRGWDPPPGSGD